MSVISGSFGDVEITQNPSNKALYVGKVNGDIQYEAEPVFMISRRDEPQQSYEPVIKVEGYEAALDALNEDFDEVRRWAEDERGGTLDGVPNEIGFDFTDQWEVYPERIKMFDTPLMCDWEIEFVAFAIRDVLYGGGKDYIEDLRDLVDFLENEYDKGWF